jgi:hypothetical protein
MPAFDDVLKANPVMDLEPKWGQGLLNGERFLRMACPSIAKHAQLVKSGSARNVSWYQARRKTSQIPTGTEVRYYRAAPEDILEGIFDEYAGQQ